jgi:hypothetical protein
MTSDPAVPVNKFANPWGLTATEAKSMDAYCRLGCAKLVAKERCMSVSTVEDHVYSAAFKMNAQGQRLIKYLMWDRFRQKQQREQVIAATEHN